MKIKEFKQILESFTELLRFEGHSKIADQITRLNSIWDGYESKTVAQFAAMIEKHAPNDQQGTSVNSFIELVFFFERLKQIFLVTKKQPVLNDIEKISKILLIIPGTTLSDKICEAKNILAKAKSKGKKTAPAIRTAIIESYLGKLKSSIHDNSEFDRTILSLKKDKNVRTLEMKKLAELFTEASINFKSKKDALDSIIEKQNFEVNYRLKRKSTNQLTSW